MYPKMMQIVSQYPSVDFFKVCQHSRSPYQNSRLIQTYDMVLNCLYAASISLPMLSVIQTMLTRRPITCPRNPVARALL